MKKYLFFLLLFLPEWGFCQSGFVATEMDRPAVTSAVTFSVTASAAQSGTTTSVSVTVAVPAANIIVIAVGYNNVITSVGDGTNIYTALPGTYGLSNIVSKLYYFASASTISGSMTFHAVGSNVSIAVIAATASPVPVLDQNGGALAVSGASVQPGSITPTFNNELIVTSTATTTAGAVTINGGYSVITAAFSGGNAQGVSLGWIVQGTAAATNPTFSQVAAGLSGCGIATFKE